MFVFTAGFFVSTTLAGNWCKDLEHKRNQTIMSVNRAKGSASSMASVTLFATFAYDRTGNWTPFNGRLYNEANEITEDSGYIYSYDLDGKLVEKASKLDLSDVTSYGWDALNRLIHVNEGPHVISYRYDGLGRRIAKVVDSVETHYALDGMRVVEERNGTNALIAVDLHAGLDALLMRQGFAAGATYWTHTDHLGSVEALADASGSVVERYRYSSFGQISVLAPDFSLLTSAPKEPFTYTSREWEPEVGLYFYRARFMNPRLGRFISRDPLEFVAGDANMQTYVGNNPINAIDPLGLKVEFANGTNPMLYAIAKGYVSVDAATKANFDKIEQSSTVYTIVENNGDDDRYKPATHERYWDPSSALRTKCGGTQSPATGLAHEVDHAANRNPILHGMADSDYQNWEEKRVITGSETSLANKLGEAVRQDHSGTPYKVSGPLSR